MRTKFDSFFPPGNLTLVGDLIFPPTKITDNNGFGDMKLKIEMNLEGKSCYPVYCRVNACGLSFVMGQNRSFAKRKTDFTPKGIFHPINIVLPRIRYW
jgi:hypothetical protein